MLTRYSEPSDFLRAVSALDASPADEHALSTGLAHELVASELPFDVSSTFFGVVEDAPGLLVVQTVPRRAVVEQIGPGNVRDEVLQAAARSYAGGPIPARNLAITEPLAERFIDAYTAAARCSASLFQRQRLHRLVRVKRPTPVDGSMRAALPTELERVLDWTEAYAREIGFADAARPERSRALESGALYVWEVAGEVVSMAAWSRPTPATCTVQLVYTPPELRGHGYASALVADLSQRILDGLPGHAPRRSANLLTDLANPTSNGIYARLGYVPVRDFVSYDIEPRE